MTYNDVRAVTRAGRKKERGGWGVGGGGGGGGREGDPLSPWSTCRGRSGCDPGLTKSWPPQEGRQSLHVAATGEKDCTGRVGAGGGGHCRECIFPGNLFYIILSFLV